MSTPAPISTSAPTARKKVTTLAFRQKKIAANRSRCLPPTIIPLPWQRIRQVLIRFWLAIRSPWWFSVMRTHFLSPWRKCFIISRAVARGAKGALLIGDMPFMSYQVSVEEATRNAGRFLQQGGMDAVKLEGGRERANAVRSITGAGIPVMGHLGLTPQSVNQLGGFRAQGKTAIAAKRLVEDALILEEAGCFSIVLESVPARLAELISKKISIPTIGIGAGVGCDGQVLVTHDLLGLFDRFTPKFVKKYANFHQEMQKAFSDYIDDVETKRFPAPEHTVEMDNKEWDALLKDIP